MRCRFGRYRDRSKLAWLAAMDQPPDKCLFWWLEEAETMVQIEMDTSGRLYSKPEKRARREEASKVLGLGCSGLRVSSWWDATE
jgi:hypothetical protein